MKLRLALIGLCAVLLAVASGGSNALAAPALQLPWPAGAQYRIHGGNTYGCDTHTNPAVNYYGIDFQFATIGESVSSTADGKVIVAVDNDLYNGGAGNYLVIDHGGGYTSRYLHLQRNLDGGPFPSEIEVGVTVTQGQVVAYSGNTGFVPPHLHFDMQSSGSAYKAEPMSGVPMPGQNGFGWYGYSVDSGLGCYNNGHDPSPYWTSQPPVGVPILPGNYDGLGKDEPAIWRPSTNTWYINGLPDIQWGAAEPGDLPVPGNYDSGNKTKTYPAIWRPATNTWYIYSLPTIQWGVSEPGDIPVPGDYDGDGDTDPAIWRPSTNTWYIYNLPDIQWGASSPGDIPVPGDYNGGNKTDAAIWRPSTNTWYINGVTDIQWGAASPGDLPVPGDYNGDGKTNAAIWRPFINAWYIYDLPDIQWGASEPGDIPVPGRYDGDNKTDPTIWRPIINAWYIYSLPTIQWGSSIPDDIPLAGDHRH